jgi:rod shape-determining protein MreD
LAKRVVKYLLLFSSFLLVQVSLIPLLTIYDVAPDLLFIGVVLSAIRHGAIAAMVTGFIAGLAQDAVGTHLYGLQALAKVVAGFVAAYFARDKLKFDLQVTLGIALAAALAHNLIRDGIYYFDADFGLWYTIVRYVIPNSLYTLVLTAIAHLLFTKRFERKN